MSNEMVKIRFTGHSSDSYACTEFSVDKWGVVEVPVKKATQLFVDFPFDWKKYDPADDPKPEKESPESKSEGGAPASGTETPPVEKMYLRYQGTTAFELDGVQVVMGQVVELQKTEALALLEADPMSWSKARAPKPKP